MKRYLTLAALAFGSITSFAQDFPGYRVGNYTGVNGVFFNPANIADSRYRFDINLVSASSFIGNNQASFKLSTIGETFSGEGIGNQVFQGNVGPTSAIVNSSIHGPSFMFNVGKKSTIAITTRARALANVVDMDGELLHELSNDLNANTTFPYSINSNNNMRFAVHGWSEFGASYSRILTESGPHFLKGGISAKYLGGAGNGFISIDNLKSTFNQDATGNVYLNNTTGRVAVGFGGQNISTFDPAGLFKMEGSGFGADLGLVYEYRPGTSSNLGRGDNKYKFKVGVALLDLGSVKYQKDMENSGTYDLDITGAERFYLSDIQDEDFQNYNRFFRSRPQFFTPANTNSESSYSVSLPTTLNIDVDYHINKGFYVSASGMFSMVGKASKVQNGMYYSNFAVTPRVEGKILGVYLPVTYNSLTNLNAGLSFRVGPLFFGSGSVITALIGESKQADVHIGVRFGGLHK